MNGINRVMLCGVLGADAEVKTLPSGQTVMNLRLAVSERYKDKSGEWKDSTTWVKCQKWGNTPDWMRNALSKGAQVTLEGRLSGNSWVDKDGNKRHEMFVKVDELVVPNTRKGEQRFSDGSGSIQKSTDEDNVPF